MTLGALVLAAGGASRFGAPKQLLEIEGETLIDRACRTALEAGCRPVLRVLGAHAEKIQERPCHESVETLVHATWHEGMGGSLAAGVFQLLETCPGLDAVFILLADQPMITPALLERMGSELGKASIVWCRHADVKGPPALFSREHFDGLLGLSGDRGARSVAVDHPAALVDFPNAAWDIDSPEAWAEFLAAYPPDAGRRDFRS